jgi:threonine dehydratase
MSDAFRPVADKDVFAAADRIRGRVLRTPVIEVSPTRTFKLELLQHTGSFKPRGMFNRVLSAIEDGADLSEGVVTASGGNAGLAVAYVARELGLPAKVFVPETAPAAKLSKLGTLGADVVRAGSEYAEAHVKARDFHARTGALLVHAYDQPEVVAGQGTLGLELLEQAEFDTVLVAVGGGGLIGGIATAIGDRAHVVGIEPELCPTMRGALAAGGPVDVPVSGVASDALGSRRLGDYAYAAIKASGVESVLVSDEQIVAARRELWQDYRLAVEHGAATAYAALSAGVYRPEPDERVLIVLCGANTDPSDLN